MSMVEGVLKTMALPALGAVAGLAYVTGWGPYGLTKPMPRCGEQPPCIIVTGLDGDVRYLPTGADASLVDLNDEAVTRLVVWLREELPPLDADEALHSQRAAGAVLKYPRAVSIGEPGTPDELEVRRRALEQAVSLGVKFGADLVVIGGVDGGTYELAIVDPNAPPQQLALTRYTSDGTRAPAALGPALREALGRIPAPAQSAAVAPAAPDPARPAPIPAEPEVRPTAERVAPATPAAPSPGARAQTPQAMPRNQIQPPPSGWDLPPSNPVTESRPPPRPALPARAAAVMPEDILRRAQSTPSLYPERALERGRGGVVRLGCTVRADGGADCLVFSEEPRGWGFGEAALEAARTIRVRTTNANGQSTVGLSFFETVRFNLAD